MNVEPNLDALIPYLVEHARAITIKMGWEPENPFVSTAQAEDSIFKGIAKAEASRPLSHAEMGLFHIELVSNEYDTQRFTGRSIQDAANKAAAWIRERP